jgi:hypothetical protein
MACYRIQGPKLIIEFSPQGVGGDPTMHVHPGEKTADDEDQRVLILDELKALPVTGRSLSQKSIFKIVTSKQRVTLLG